MTKQEMKTLVKSAIIGYKLMNVYFRFDKNYYNIIPLLLNENLFLVINEDDFIFDGYSVFRFKDVTKVTTKNDKCDEIIKSEGLTANITVPNIDITNWKSVFGSLKAMNQNIIIQKQTIHEEDNEFVIGNIERIYKNFAYVRHFDANGIWQDDPYQIPYSEITSITFASRYVTVFSKHIAALPVNQK